MQIGVKLLTPIKDIENFIIDEYIKYLKSRKSRLVTYIKGAIVELIIKSIIDTEEYRSLVSGQLKGDLGIPDADSRIRAIIGAWISNYQIDVTLQKTSNKFNMKFEFNYIKSDFSDILSLGEAIIFSKGGNVPWLEWLLLEGNRVLIRDYFVRYDLNSFSKRFSRTGEAVMNYGVGQNFKIDSHFQGTKNNNWITRAFDGVSSSLENILTEAIDRVL